ncbi:MAG TPA: hypothetical protein VJ972_16705 [Anaerolineales bacterium]|nr:hypothetical protein [Anaerolineales bacterium]
MKLNYAVRSLLILVLSIAFLLIFTLLDSTIADLSTMLQRVITILALVITPLIGTVLGVMSFLRKDGPVWLALICSAANALFALFSLAVVFFAG